MKAGTHYDQTYSPVASWNSVRTLLILSAVNDWHTKQLDFVLAFTQAPVERDIYMKIPKGFEIEDGNNNDCALQHLRPKTSRPCLEQMSHRCVS